MSLQNKIFAFFAILAFASAPIADAAQVHPGGTSGSVQYYNGSNNNATFGGLTLGTVNNVGGSVTNSFQAANTLYQATNALVIDPRYYGAACDAKYFDGRNGSGVATATASSTQVSISGYTFSTGDIGKYIAINGGSSGDIGFITQQIVSINGGGSSANVTVSPTGSTTSGYAVLAHDDTTAIHNASVFTVIFHGSYIMGPDNCTFNNLTFGNFTTIKGQAGATGYGYGKDIKPAWVMLNSGYASDTYNTSGVGINISTPYALAIENLELKGIVFPFTGFSPPPTVALVGTVSGNPNTAAGFTSRNVTFSYAGVCLGVPYGTTPSSYIFGRSENDEFASCGRGMNGNFSDWVDIASHFTGNFDTSIYIGPPGTSPGAGGASQFIGTTVEESSSGMIVDGAYEVTCSSCKFQFNNGYAIEGLNNYNLINFNGGFIQGNGTSNTSGHRAHIYANGTSAAGHMHFNNVNFEQHNYSAGGVTQYLVEFGTSGANNPDFSIYDGSVSEGYSTAESVAASTYPTLYSISTMDNGGMINSAQGTHIVTFPASVRGAVTSSPTISTATFTPNFSLTQDYSITLVHASCPCTLANPSNLAANQHGTIIIKQSSTGSDLIGTWGSDYQITGGTSAITLSTAANAQDVFNYFTPDGSHVILFNPDLNVTH